MRTRLLTAVMVIACAAAGAQTAPKDFTVCMGDTLKGKVREATCFYYLFNTEDGTVEKDLWTSTGVAFDRQGRKTRQTGPGCIDMSYKYDAQGRLVLETGRPFVDDLHYTSTTRYTYDDKGRLAAMETDQINSDYYRITYAYDDKGRLAEEVRYKYDYEAEWVDDSTPVYVEAGRETYSYDSAPQGSFSSALTPSSGSQERIEEYYGYGNGVVGCERDMAGRRVKLFLEEGQTILLRYDSSDMVVEKRCIGADGKPEEILLDNEDTYIYAVRMTSKWGPGGILSERAFYGPDGNAICTFKVDVKTDKNGNATQWLGLAIGAPDYMYALVKRKIAYY